MKKCLVVLTTFALAAGAFAADFKTTDKDGDGKVSKEEFTGGKAKLEKKFKKLDKDGDDSLTEEEFKAGEKKAKGKKKDKKKKEAK